MRMDTGIGRTGIRLLALFMLAIGGLGIAVLWNGLPGGPGTLTGLGIGIVVVALVVLAGLAWPDVAAVPRSKRHAKTRKGRKTDPKETLYEAPDTIDVVGPAPAGDMTFTDLSVTPEPARPSVQPAITRSDPRAWPERPKAVHPTVPVLSDDRVKRDGLAKKYTERTPMVRNILSGDGRTAVYEEIPEITAHMALQGGATPVPDGMTRGQCGSCRTHILAPTVRPIRLRCPRCGRSNLLRG